MNKELKFTFDRETKNTYRFQEKEERDVVNDIVIGTLYVQKSAFGEEERPDEITVTIKTD